MAENWWEAGEIVDTSQQPKARPEWGAGAVELPDGSIVRQGPRGGTTVLSGPTKTVPGTAPQLSAEEGKTQGFAKLMNTAERQYQDAVRRGYNPNSISSGFANWLEGPEGTAPLAGLAPLIRNDAADAAKAAERAWLDAQLKAMTGAGQSKGEAVSNPMTYFPRFGEGAGLAAQKEETRATAYAAARGRAGPASAGLPETYLTQRPKALRQATDQQFAAAQRLAGGGEPVGTQGNPYVPVTRPQYNKLPDGAWYVASDGSVGQKRSAAQASATAQAPRKAASLAEIEAEILRRRGAR